MNYYISHSADAGIRKKINQDCGFVEKAISKAGKLVFAVLCDGMGGFSRGEEASRTIVDAFSRWFYENMPKYTDEEITRQLITEQWTSVIRSVNSSILSEATKSGEKMGSTVTALLLLHDRYFLLNIGDTRAYRIGESNMTQLTTDHTLVEEQIRLGKLTRQQAEVSPVRNVLTKCVGAVENAVPDFFFGETACGEAYVLCTDGFRHVLSPEEIKEALYTNTLSDISCLASEERRLIELNMQRGEKDNISVITILTRE